MTTPPRISLDDLHAKATDVIGLTHAVAIIREAMEGTSDTTSIGRQHHAMKLALDALAARADELAEDIFEASAAVPHHQRS